MSNEGGGNDEEWLAGVAESLVVLGRCMGCVWLVVVV